jgi:hypothetical protein
MKAMEKNMISEMSSKASRKLSIYSTMMTKHIDSLQFGFL